MCSLVQGRCGHPKDEVVQLEVIFDSLDSSGTASPYSQDLGPCLGTAQNIWQVPSLLRCQGDLDAVPP